MTNSGLALQYASKALQADKDVVLAAVNNNGCSLQYASEALKGDKKIALAAVTTSNKAWHYVSRELLNCSFNGGNLHFARTVTEASSGKFVRDFPGLNDSLVTLYDKLQAINNKFGQRLPPWWERWVFHHHPKEPLTFARQWFSRLWETQWCFDQVCKNGSASLDIQQHIFEFSDLADDIKTMGLLRAYAPILCALLDKTDFDSWWELLLCVLSRRRISTGRLLRKFIIVQTKSFCSKTRSRTTRKSDVVEQSSDDNESSDDESSEYDEPSDHDVSSGDGGETVDDDESCGDDEQSVGRDEEFWVDAWGPDDDEP